MTYAHLIAIVMVVVQLLGGRLVYILDSIFGGLEGIYSKVLDRVTYFIVVSQQFQTSSVRHQAHTDQNVENK